MNKKILLISIIISINIHLLIFLYFLNSGNFKINDYKKENFQFKINFDKPLVNILLNKNIETNNNTKYSMPNAVNNLTISKEYIENIINTEKFEDTEAILLNNEEFEFTNEIDVNFKAKIYINEKGIVENIEIEKTNIEDEKLNELKIIIGKLKFKPAIKNGKGVSSTKEIIF